MSWRDDLLRRQIAHQLLRAGVAEGAIERAADLARDAERAAIALGNIDAFDFGALVQRDRPGRMRISHLRVPSVETCSSTISGRASVKCSASCCAHDLGDIEHGVEIVARPGNRSNARAARRACGSRAPASRSRARRRRGRRASARPATALFRGRNGNSCSAEPLRLGLGCQGHGVLVGHENGRSRLLSWSPAGGNRLRPARNFRHRAA